MKILKGITASVLALGMISATGVALAAPAPAPQQYGGQPYGNQPYGYGQPGRPGWDTPPGEYNEFRRKGFQDGIYGARKDAENHRPFTPQNRDEYRHPGVPRNVYRDYRQAFREGYARAVRNMTGR